MYKTGFNHKYAIGDEVYFPIEDRITKGRVIKITFHSNIKDKADHIEYLISTANGKLFTRSEKHVLPI